MEHSKLYQYENVAKVSALDYSGKLAVKTTGDNQYDVSSPVNTAENYSVNEDVIVLSNTLDNEEPMKFSFSFKVNKSAIGTGTNLLLDMPGLFSVKSENNTLWFKFYYEDAPAWKYINASELIDGWNNVALVGDGVKVTLTVNSTVHTILDSSLKTVYVTYKGGQYKYLQMKETAPLATADSWEIQTIFKCHKSGSASYPAIFAYSGGSDYKTPCLTYEGGSYRFYLSSSGTSWNLNTGNTGFIPEDGKTYDIVAGFTGTQYYVKWRLFGTEEWTGNWTLESTTKVYCSVPFWWLNCSLNSYNYYNAGELYMSNTKIIVNGETWFDGAGDTGFINTDCIRNEITEGPVYPSLSIGTLNTYQSWLYLKDIEALKIEGTKPDDQEGDKPQGSDSYQEIQYPIDQTIVDRYTSKLSSGSALFTAVYNGVRLYLHTYSVYVDPSNVQVISMTAYTGIPGSKKPKEVGCIEGKDKDGVWIYEYRDYDADQTVDAVLPRAKFLAWKA